MQIRSVNLEDAPQVAAQIAALLTEFAPDAPTDAGRLIETAKTVLALPSVTGFLAEVAGEPLGLVMLNECAAVYAGGVFGEITELYVTPARRSEGIAAKLLTRATEEGRARGWARIEVGAP
ncbi:MAG: GNAT family N-acetyltransferase, partial [Paracoccaceae bacterium]